MNDFPWFVVPLALGIAASLIDEHFNTSACYWLLLTVWIVCGVLLVLRA